MLASYVQGLCKTYRLARKSDADSVKAWNDTSRVVLALARSLRLTTQSQLGKGTAARATENGTPLSYYQRAELDDSEMNDDRRTREFGKRPQWPLSKRAADHPCQLFRGV
jgi:hypothetical protein